MSDEVTREALGYYSIRRKPTAAQLETYYRDRYYQDELQYQRRYDDEETEYIRNKIEQKYAVLESLLGDSERNQSENRAMRFLDVGCGEGWTLAFFHRRGWICRGLDHSDHALRAHHPHLCELLTRGDLEAGLADLCAAGARYEVIWLDNVLEHALDPARILAACQDVLDDQGILVVEVPNDFSEIQNDLLERDHIGRAFWVRPPDHLSYFRRGSLVSLCESVGLECVDSLADFPIEVYLYHPRSNYVTHPEAGRECHRARMEIENLLHRLSVEKTNELYRVLAELGLGRDITGFFRRSGGGRAAAGGQARGEEDVACDTSTASD
jgi:2-polyprenyl-3-methyl-5-hydroxy-6-metoxy-1,4-benzoquinol methylase